MPGKVDTRYLFNDYFVDRYLGRGMMGNVLKVLYAGTPVAQKTFTHNLVVNGREAEDDGRLHHFRNEITALSEIRHPNVVSMIAHSDEMILTELYDGSASKIETLSEMAIVARDCMRALVFLSAYPGCIMHGDIKPGNILVRRDGDGKITHASLGDLGLARACQGHRRFSGTPGYMPQPNPTSNNGHDIYALAVSLLNAKLGGGVHAAYHGRFEDNTRESAARLPDPLSLLISEMLDMHNHSQFGGDAELRQRYFFKLLWSWEDMVNLYDGDVYLPDSEEEAGPDAVNNQNDPDSGDETHTVYPPGYFDPVKQTWFQWIRRVPAETNDHKFRDFRRQLHIRREGFDRGYLFQEVTTPKWIPAEPTPDAAPRPPTPKRKPAYRDVSSVHDTPDGPRIYKEFPDNHTLMRRHKDIPDLGERREFVRREYGI